MKAQPAFSIEQAQALILRAIIPLGGKETVALQQACGRVAASDVVAPGDQPRFDGAAMDGWAVCGQHATYRLVGESRAGARYTGLLGDGEAVAISTGAVMPQGASALIRREKGREDDGILTISGYTPGRDVRPRGCDFAMGDVLVESGRRLDHLDIARIAAAGLGHVAVRRTPSFGLLATGDEIVPAGTFARDANAYDALSPAIAARLQIGGAHIEHLGIVGDRDAAIHDRLRDGFADALIVIGGASGGRHDRVRHALEPLGLQVVVPCVAMRPGKPFWCGILGDGRVVFGLPGNPVAALVALELFVLPALSVMMGHVVAQRWLTLPGAPAPDAGEAARLRFARWDLGADGMVHATPLGRDDSAALSPLRGANGLIRTGEGHSHARLLPINFQG